MCVRGRNEKCVSEDKRLFLLVLEVRIFVASKWGFSDDLVNATWDIHILKGKSCNVAELR